MSMTNSQRIVIMEFRAKWKDYEKQGFSQIDRIKLLVFEAKDHWLIGDMATRQWCVVETVAYCYKEESEEKLQVFTDMIGLLIDPQKHVSRLIHLDEDDFKERTELLNKWNPPDNPLFPTKEWNDLWLKDFDRPTLPT